MKILVTGGAGFIASHVVDKYLEANHRVEVIDDMSRGRKENMRDDVVYHTIDIRSESVAKVFESGKFEVVNHHAAQMDVRRSTQDPLFDPTLCQRIWSAPESIRGSGCDCYICIETALWRRDNHKRKMASRQEIMCMWMI